MGPPRFPSACLPVDKYHGAAGKMSLQTLAVVSILALGADLGRAAPMTIQLAPPQPPTGEVFHLGTNRAPDGMTVSLDRRSLLLNGRRWTPVMGEFHYARYPAAEWADELRKLKAGGIDIVATYVFWIHHEEVEGQWDWSGDRGLREFVGAAGAAGLKVIVRCGPWCHGEVRNGGLPDWIVAQGHVRSSDPEYLRHVAALFAQIAGQLRGQLWKDGGPVIGVQLENEFPGPAEHLLTLKRLAREAGLDVPLYTRTGWPALQTPLPFGEIIPLYGAYAEGFWDRELTAMPGRYWTGFQFSMLRSDANIANEALGRRDAPDEPDTARYPYLTCEIGGGMMSAYHRRILADPADVEAITLVKLGSGSTSPGYYMYHGGTNPEGRRTTLMEDQATSLTNWNDLPTKNYDFQAPIGQYGQLRAHYYLLRRLHSFLHAFGERLAGMDTFLPDGRPTGKDDVTTLRWSARSDGLAGFVFVNNHERGRSLPAKPAVQFTLGLADHRNLTFPASPVTVPAEACFFWPFNLELGDGVTLAWATAQPVDRGLADGVRTFTFVATPGIAPRFCFPHDVIVPGARSEGGAAGLVYDLPAGSRTEIRPAHTPDVAPIRIIVLRDTDSLAPEPTHRVTTLVVKPELLRPAGPLRPILLGKTAHPVAAAPVEADFANAALWRVRLPAGLGANSILRLHYVGDVARVMIGGHVVMDDFYNGAPLEIGLQRHAAALVNGELTIAILPLQKGAPVYFSSRTAIPDFGPLAAIANLKQVELSFEDVHSEDR